MANMIENHSYSSFYVLLKWPREILYMIQILELFTTFEIHCKPDDAFIDLTTRFALRNS